MRFKEFIGLNETGTSTADVATFSRIAIPLVRRQWPSEVEDLVPDEHDWNKKKKKSYRVPQLDESASRATGISYDKRTGQLVGVPARHAIRLTKLPRMFRGEELAALVPERADHVFALHPDNWVYTFSSLTGKDPEKIAYYGPVAIPLSSGTLVAEMGHATAFMYGRNENELALYRESLKPLSSVNIFNYKRPELLVPAVG